MIAAPCSIKTLSGSRRRADVYSCNRTLTAEHQTSLDLTVFRVQIEGVKEDLSTSADVISGITLRLRDPAALASVLLEQSAFRGLMHPPLQLSSAMPA
jgi:hypothetical protein